MNGERAQQDSGADKFLDIAHGNRATARRLRDTLQRIANNGSRPELREMADEVLAGRIDLREAVSVPAYSEALQESAERGLAAMRQMSEEEWAEAEAEGRRQLEAYAQDPGEAGEPREEAPQRRTERAWDRRGRSRHDGSGWSLY